MTLCWWGVKPEFTHTHLLRIDMFVYEAKMHPEHVAGVETVCRPLLDKLSDFGLHCLFQYSRTSLAQTLMAGLPRLF